MTFPGHRSYMDDDDDTWRSAGDPDTVAYATGFRIRAWSGKERILDMPYENSNDALQFGLRALDFVGEGKQITRMETYAVPPGETVTQP